MERTIYILAGGQPQPAQAKLGISDGIHTELLEGLKESDAVITGMITPQTTPSAQQPGSPFGGGMRRF